MSKIRVYELAKELGLDNRELVARITALGVPVRNHMSALESIDVDRIRRSLIKDKAERRVEERIRPTVVRRRAASTRPDAPHEEAAAVVSASEQRSESGQPPATVARPSKVEATPKDVASERPASSPPSATVADEAVVEAKPTELPLAAAQVSAPTETETQAAEPAPSTSSKATPVPASPPPVRSRPIEREFTAEEQRQPAPASVRFAHANLPPGVVARGGTVVPGAPPLSPTTAARIVSQHMPPPSRQVYSPAPQEAAPRRRELGRAALVQSNRPQPSRPTRRKQVGSKKGQKTEITTPSAQKRVIRIEDQVGLQTLAQRMSLKATDLLMKLVQLGMTNVNINSTLDAETAQIIASEFSYEVENVAKTDDELISAARGEYENEATDRMGRPPIVTVMGHVDHGKTSLLDAIRSSDVASREAGGITQHIGAHRVETKGGTVVFLDTPGHEAFTAMRSRGAQATDVVILVVAADDGVMPQTKEAVNHAKAAKVPLIVAINKIDKPGAQPEVIKRELSSEGLQPEDWGGDTMYVEVSALTKKGIDTLLQGILLQSEMLELQANPKIPAEGVVLEAYLDKGRGPVANVLVQDGTLATGDLVVAGAAWGKVRAMRDDRGKATAIAKPSTPVEVLGLSEMPAAGDRFYVVRDARVAQEVSNNRRQQIGQAGAVKPARGLDQIYQIMRGDESRELPLVIKGDVQGSVEAIKKALTDLSTDQVKVSVIHGGVGGITENDVMLASASNAVLIGFNVRAAGNAGSLAKTENVDIRSYTIIYEAIDEVKKAMSGLLKPKFVEKVIGTGEVRQIFSIPKIGVVAGCYVQDGKIQRSGKVRLIRDSVQVWEGGILALKRFKDDVREVAAGYECGLSLEGFNDIKEKDIVECFDTEEVPVTL